MTGVLKQTIALFRYQLLGIIHLKMIMVLIVIMLASMIMSLFIGELAIINSEAISRAFMAELFRYGLAVYLMVSVCQHVAQGYAMNEFERILSMPVSRAQYLLSLVMVVNVLAALFVIPVLISGLLLSSLDLTVYWMVAVYLELILVGLFSILAVISLEKLSVAIIFSFGLYLLAKVTPLISLALDSSMQFYEDELTYQFAAWFFSMLLYLLPGLNAFAQNNVFFENADLWGLLSEQLFSVIIYSILLFTISLIDFYRKEFSG